MQEYARVANFEKWSGFLGPLSNPRILCSESGEIRRTDLSLTGAFYGRRCCGTSGLRAVRPDCDLKPKSNVADESGAPLCA